MWFHFKYEFGDLERSRSTGEDLEIVLCGYITMTMNSEYKFNVVIAFEISTLLCWSDVISLIGLDLSAWAAVFAPSLDLLGILGHAVRAAARHFRQLGR